MNRPTQVDVARRAGVSRATVSYVLNGQTAGRVPISVETRQRVLEAMDNLGYQPDARAQALASGSTKTIAFIIPDLRNPHFCEYATGIELEAQAAGYRVLLSSTTLNDAYAIDIFNDLARRRIDGLILAGSFLHKSPESQATVAQVRQRGLPMVELDDLYGVDAVTSNYRDATNEVMSYLLNLGHRHIGLIYGVGARELGEDRLEPYQASLRAAGLPDESFIVECGPTIEEGYQAALKLLNLAVPPTAIIAINDLLAMSTLRAAADCGLSVPKDLSVVGYDDIPMASITVPRLTTVTKDALSMGRRACAMLFARIQDPDLPRQQSYSATQLVIRESTGPAPLSAPNHA